MQPRSAYIEILQKTGHTVDGAHIGGAVQDCVLLFSNHTLVGHGIDYLAAGDADAGSVWRIFKKGVYRFDMTASLAKHADTNITAAITQNLTAAAQLVTPTAATAGLIGGIRRITVPAAASMLIDLKMSQTFYVNDARANTVNVGSTLPGLLLRVLMTGAVADTHPTTNVLGTAADWNYRLIRLGDCEGVIPGVVT